VRARLEPLSKLVGLPRNPKLHNLGDIHQSIERFGFVNRIIINDETDHMLAGNGRIEALRQMKVSNKKAPKGVEVRLDDWYVPTDRVSIPDNEEEALAIALNHIGENEWDDARMAEILCDLAAQDELKGTGFDGDDVDYLLRKIAPAGMGDMTQEDMNAYQEEKGRWRWLRLNITEKSYDRWLDMKKRMSSMENDDQFVEFLLNLVDESLLELL